jgi:hypothetical protein
MIIEFDVENLVSNILRTIQDVDSHIQYKELLHLRGEFRVLPNGTRKQGLYKLNAVMEKIDSPPFKKALTELADTFFDLKEEEHQLIDVLLESTLSQNEILRMKSLNLLLAIFSKHESLQEFFEKLVLVSPDFERD